MRITHVVMIVAALFCAGIAALMTRAWLVSQSANPQEQIAAVSPTQSIVVATKSLKYGDKLDEESVKLIQWPAQQALPQGAFTSVEAMLGGKETRIVLQEMGANELVLRKNLQGYGTADTIISRLGERMKAVTIRVNEIAGVAGFIQPEDRVDVLHIYGLKSGPETARKDASAVKVLLQGLRVLAVDQLTQRQGQPTPAKAVTLEVTTEEAQVLALAGQAGELSLTLNRIAGSDEVEIPGTIIYENLINDNRNNGAAPVVGGPRVKIWRSTEGTDYSVPNDSGRDEFGANQILLNQQGVSRLPGQ